MRIMVFPDGETFNTLEGCMISEVPDELEIEDVEELLSEDQEEILYTFHGKESKAN